MEKKYRVFKIKEMKAQDRGPGLKGWPLITGDVGSEHLTTGITEFQPGANLAMHIHNCEEQVTMLEGEATVVIDGTSYAVAAPDSTFIPAGVPHRFINTSDKPMKILWIYATTRMTRTFVDTGKNEKDLKK